MEVPSHQTQIHSQIRSGTVQHTPSKITYTAHCVFPRMHRPKANKNTSTTTSSQTNTLPVLKQPKQTKHLSQHITKTFKISLNVLNKHLSLALPLYKKTNKTSRTAPPAQPSLARPSCRPTHLTAQALHRDEALEVGVVGVAGHRNAFATGHPKDRPGDGGLGETRWFSWQ